MGGWMDCLLLRYVRTGSNPASHACLSCISRLWLLLAPSKHTPTAAFLLPAVYRVDVDVVEPLHAKGPLKICCSSFFLCLWFVVFAASCLWGRTCTR